MLQNYKSSSFSFLWLH